MHRYLQVKEAYPDTQMMIGTVAYRDHCDGNDRIQYQPFQSSIPGFESFLGTIVAKGGGDGPEDVHGGLEQATK